MRKWNNSNVEKGCPFMQWHEGAPFSNRSCVQKGEKIWKIFSEKMVNALVKYDDISDKELFTIEIMVIFPRMMRNKEMCLCTRMYGNGYWQ